MNLLIPKVSIVTSLWMESDDLLQRCAESILGQTFTNFEWIIVDDGASRRNLEILKCFNDPRIKIIKNKTNLGLTASLNKAISLSLGNYIARMDTDDCSLPLRIEKQFFYMESNKDCVLCGCFYEEEIQGKKFKSSVKEIQSFVEIKKNISIFNPIAHPTWFFRKDVFLKVGGYNESFQYAQDYELLSRFIAHGQVCNLPEVLFIRNIAANRISSKNNREQLLYSLQIRMKIFIHAEKKLTAFFSIFKSSVKFLLYPLLNKEIL